MHTLVYSVIADTLNIDRNALTPDTEIERITTDSLQLFELVMALEQTFDHQCDYEALVQITTINDIFTYIEQRGLTPPDDTSDTTEPREKR